MGRQAKLFQSDWIYLRMEDEPRGVKDCLGPPETALVLHSGQSVNLTCTAAGKRHFGTRVHGDINIIPSGVPSRWDATDSYTELSIRIPGGAIADALPDADSRKIEIVPRFQLRDPRIEHLARALYYEFDAGSPNGRIFSESIATALGAVLANQYSSFGQDSVVVKNGLPGKRLRDVIDYIEANLASDLSLLNIAKVAGLSLSHCKTMFRKTTGVPIHQYVLERRVQRAKELLMQGTLSVGDVAAAVGFADGSHLARHTRRVLGLSPSEIRGQID